MNQIASRKTLAGALATLALCGLQSISQAQSRPSWSGRLSAQPAAFNAFMRRNVGKTVDLNVTFRGGNEFASGAEPYTSLGGDTGPIFSVGGSLYRVENGGNERTWRTLMGYDKNRRQLFGTFGIMSGVKSGEDSGYIFDLRWRPNFARNVKVNVVDERGRIVLRTSGITLRGGHIQVPVVAYKELGLDVRRDVDGGKVSLGTPKRYREASPDTTTFDIVYNSATYRKNGSETKFNQDFKPPFVLLQNGEFFLPPSLVQRSFSDKLSTKWDASTRTITLRRSQSFAGLLNQLSEVT